LGWSPHLNQKKHHLTIRKSCQAIFLGCSGGRRCLHRSRSKLPSLRDPVKRGMALEGAHRGKSQQIRQFCAGGDFVNYTHPLIYLIPDFAKRRILRAAESATGTDGSNPSPSCGEPGANSTPRLRQPASYEPRARSMLAAVGAMRCRLKSFSRGSKHRVPRPRRGCASPGCRFTRHAVMKQTP
jgi:hypothetical protein